MNRPSTPIVWTWNGRRAARAALALAVAGLVGVMPKVADGTNRLLHGVRPGVSLDGRPMGWLLPSEVQAVLDGLADAYSVPPVDARPSPDGRGILAEQEGRMLNRDETLRRLLAAAPFSRVEPAFARVIPSISRRHYAPIYRGPSDRPWVAFAVNVDWGEEFLPSMLEVLRRKQVRVTFFPTASWADKFPDLARRLAEEGHEIGNHGSEHYHPKDLDSEELRRMVAEADVRLERLTGQRPTLFAPPYGEVDGRISEVAASLGYYTVMWTVDTLDWQRPPADQIVDRILQRVNNGAIVLMHPTEPTVEALGIVIEALKQRGYVFVTVGAMVAALTEERPHTASGEEPNRAAAAGEAATTGTTASPEGAPPGPARTSGR